MQLSSNTGPSRRRYSSLLEPILSSHERKNEFYPFSRYQNDCTFSAGRQWLRWKENPALGRRVNSLQLRLIRFYTHRQCGMTG